MQVLRMLSEDGALSDILGAGARLLECACGPCIGMGQSPNSGAVSLRTFNRNLRDAPALRTPASISSAPRSPRLPLSQAC